MNCAHCVLAAERRKNIAPGASPGYTVTLDLSPGGAKDSNGLKKSSAPPGLGLAATQSTGLRPCLHSYAAPRLERLRRSAAGTLAPLRGWNARLQFIHTFYERRFSWNRLVF